MIAINYEEYSVHPLALLFPMMGDAELQELANDVKKRGLREPIVLYNEQVLDGRNRLAACKLAGIEPEYCEVEDHDDEHPFDAMGWVLSHNLHRRHLTTAQRALIAARVIDLERDAAKERQKQGREKLPDPSTAGRARDKAGTLLGVSGRTVDQAAKVISQAVPELVRLVETGDVSISVAAAAATAGADAQKSAARLGKHGVNQLARRRRKRERADVDVPEPSAVVGGAA